MHVRRFVLRPQFLRVALPTLTWIVIYGVANALLRQDGVRGVNGSLTDPGELGFTGLVRALLGGPAAYHLWFVYVLLGIYLTVPLLRALTDRPEPQRRQLLTWFLVLWLIADLLPRWGAYFLGDRWTPEVADDWAAAYGVVATTMIAAAEESEGEQPAWWEAAWDVARGPAATLGATRLASTDLERTRSLFGGLLGADVIERGDALELRWPSGAIVAHRSDRPGVFGMDLARGPAGGLRIGSALLGAHPAAPPPGPTLPA